MCAQVSCEALVVSGLRVFLDRVSLENRAPLLPSLEAAISGSSAALVVLTRESLSRVWIRLELDVMRKRQSMGRLRILALRLDPDCEVPQLIPRENVIDASRYDEADAIASKIMLRL